MRLRKHLLMAATVFLFAVFVAEPVFLFANADRFKKGEWSAMSQDYKLEFVKMALDDLKVMDVPVNLSPDEYLHEMNKLFDKSAVSTEIGVTETMPSIVYRKEPDCRKIMDSLVKKRQLAKIDPTK